MTGFGALSVHAKLDSRLKVLAHAPQPPVTWSALITTSLPAQQALARPTASPPLFALPGSPTLSQQRSWLLDSCYAQQARGLQLAPPAAATAPPPPLQLPPLPLLPAVAQAWGPCCCLPGSWALLLVQQRHQCARTGRQQPQPKARRRSWRQRSGTPRRRLCSSSSGGERRRRRCLRRACSTQLTACFSWTRSRR